MANVAIGAHISGRSDATVDAVRTEALGLIKRLLSILIVLICIIALVTQKDKLIAIVDHPIERMQVSGSFNNLEEGSVDAVLASFVGEGFFSVDLENIKQQVESLPWVKSATVSRVWPGQVSLFLMEQEAVSVWNGSSLLNPNGMVFTPTTLPESLMVLPKLYGNERFTETRKRSMFDMFQLLTGKLAEYGQSVSALELNARNAWEITLANNISVALGALDNKTPEGKEKLSSKLERVGAVFTSRANVNLTDIERIDARYPNGVAIKWRKEVSKKEFK